jgi:acyl-CoA synthetase (AMP-forming)/AMP-acid ligase II
MSVHRGLINHFGVNKKLSQPSTIPALLKAGQADAIAIAAPGRTALTYQELRVHVEQTVAALNRLGIGRNDRVAIVLPNGPEMAAAFVSVAAGATTAPLNPAYQAKEFDFYLSDLGAKALLVEQGSVSPAIEVAAALQIPVFEITIAKGKPAGLFEILPGRDITPGEQPVVSGGLAEPDDIALVLHTSGTTSRPKIVPLSHTNVCASAGNIRKTLALTPDDRCLNIMPLFHIHGLMAAILSSLSAGSSVFCTPGFDALKFFAWLEEAKPTWYSAVPTMHQAILSRAGRNQDIVAATRLRFIRSSSSSLPPQVMAELQKTFNAPVIEAYAMTEASHQMTSNPLPPGQRKPGTVGIAAGPEVAIMDEVGALLPSGSVGEVVIRGPNVTRGYENNPKANAESFSQGWFRTGDQGMMDEEGYLTITGRLKEIINRGGEKISPREVDDILMDHPAVQQVVTFAIPHDKLGEDVAAAIVLREGVQASEQEIRKFAADRLANFKVPRKIIFLDEIPKGATGKLQRIGLAEKLGVA